MSECYLICNIVKCRKELKTNAWVTCCSHIFCDVDGQTAIEKEKCPACGHIFSDRLDIVSVDLNPSTQFKTMVLAGLNPETVLDIASRSLTLWTYQMFQELLYRNSALKNANDYSASLADYCATINAKHKIQIEKLGRDIQSLQKELDEKTRHIEELVSQLAARSRLLKDLQSEYTAFKRKSLVKYVNDTAEGDCGARSRSGGAKSKLKPPHTFLYEGNPINNHHRSNSTGKQDFMFEFQPVNEESGPKMSLFKF